MASDKRLARRDFLRLGIASGCTLALGGCASSSFSEPDSKGITEIRGFNVHPYTDAVMAAQIQALNEMNVNWVRTTLGILTDLAGPYIAAIRANILGLIGDFNLGPIDKHDWPDMVETVIRRYPSIQYFQILNEPEHFNGISNAEYVLDYLRPAHDLIRSKFPDVKIVSAAPIGQPKKGIRDFGDMSSAGADLYCDFRAVHIYFEQNVLFPWSAFRRATEKPIMITETGSRRADQHLDWWRSQVPKMKRVLNTEYVFYYVLLDHPVSTGFEIITGELDSRGNVVPASGSELYNHLRS
jgi:hypothetical protein